MFHKIDVLKSFEKFAGKHLCWSFFNKAAGEKRVCHNCVPMNVFSNHPSNSNNASA